MTILELPGNLQYAVEVFHVFKNDFIGNTGAIIQTRLYTTCSQRWQQEKGSQRAGTAAVDC